MKFLYLIAYPFILFCSAIWFILGSLFRTFILKGKNMDKFVTSVVRFAIKFTCKAFNIKLVIEGIEKIKGPSVLLPKHESTVDVGLMMIFFGEPAFVMKQEYSFPPFIGVRLSKDYGALRIKRDQWISSMRNMIIFAKNALLKGKHFVIFPEGSRSKPGEVYSVKGGVFLLSRKLEADFFPVRIENSGICFGRSLLSSKKAGIIKITICDPLPKDLTRQEFEAELIKNIAPGNVIVE